MPLATTLILILTPPAPKEKQGHEAGAQRRADVFPKPGNTGPCQIPKSKQGRTFFSTEEPQPRLVLSGEQTTNQKAE